MTIAGGATLDLNGATQQIGSLSGVAGSSVLLGSGTLTLGGNNTSTTFSGVISGSGGVVKAGSGTFTMEGANTYAGATTITTGILKIGANNVLPYGAGKGAVSISTGAKLDLSGFNQTINGLSGSGTVDNTVAGSPVLTLGANDATATFSGIIQNTAGSLALIKTGAGTIALAGTNTYSGSTSVNSGVLEVRNAAALGNTAAGTIVQNGASLLIGQSLTIGNEALSLSGGGGGGGGALRISSSSTVDYGGAVTLADLTSIKLDANAALHFTNSSGIAGTDKDLTFITDAGAIATVSGLMNLGSGKLTKNNSGALILEGNAVAVGSTSIAGGSLEIDSLSATMGEITGGGALIVGNGVVSAQVTASSLVISHLRIESGAKLSISASGGAANGDVPMQPVPEPASIISLILAGLTLLAGRRTFWRR